MTDSFGIEKLRHYVIYILGTLPTNQEADMTERRDFAGNNFAVVLVKVVDANYPLA